jgi:hypothetical protein
MSEQALKPVNQTYKIDLFPYPVSDLNKQQLIPLMNKNMSSQSSSTQQYLDRI